MRAALIGTILALATAIPGVGHAAASVRHVPTPVLYRASWRHGLGGWLPSDRLWSVRYGILSCLGAKRSTIVAPFHPPNSSYNVIARIRLVRYQGNGIYVANSFGILFWGNLAARQPGRQLSALGGGIIEIGTEGSTETYSAAIITNPYNPYMEPALGNNDDFDPGTRWHTYRLEVRGSRVQMFIDKRELVDVSQRHILKGLAFITGEHPSLGSRIGLYSVTSQIEVSSFEVVAA